MCRGGTSVYGLVGMVLLGGWLHLMILEVFSNLWIYDSLQYLKKSSSAKKAGGVLFLCRNNVDLFWANDFTTIWKHCSCLEPPQKSRHKVLCWEQDLYLQKLINYVRTKSVSFSTTGASWLIWKGHISYQKKNKYTSYLCEHMNIGSCQWTSCCSNFKMHLSSL